MSDRFELERGVFCLSIDLELAWGTFDIVGIDAARKKALIARENVVPGIMELLSRYEISATWGVVGHLFLDRCSGSHSSLRPSHPWYPNWLEHDHGSDETLSPELYGRRIIDDLKALSPVQDIGLHGFSHCIWGKEGCDIDVAREDLRLGLEAASSAGVKISSFIFPRNCIAFTELLAASGIKIYRSNPNVKYTPLDKVKHMISQSFGFTPPTYIPSVEGSIARVPHSYIYLSMDGFRKNIPVNSRIKSVVKGIEAAISKKEVFHMFFHPINLAYKDRRRDKLLHGLEEIFRYASAKRRAGKLEILNMKDISKKIGEA